MGLVAAADVGLTATTSIDAPPPNVSESPALMGFSENTPDWSRWNARAHPSGRTAITTSALVPGLNAENLNIQVLEDVVRIEGEYKAEDAEYLVRELPQGSFTRTLRLPAAIDADHVEAKIADGLLTLTLPKAESAKPKKIKINVK